VELLRKNTDDLHLVSIEREPLADYLRAFMKLAMPNSVTQNDAILAGRGIGWFKRSAEDRPDS